MEKFGALPPERPEAEEKEPYLEGSAESDEALRARLRERVRENYLSHEVAPQIIEEFMVHNGQVEELVGEFSEAEGFTSKEKEIAVLGAILHDIAKGYGDFLDHGTEGAREAARILVESGISEELARSVARGIERHMGQEGFVAEAARTSRGEAFSYPQPRTKVGELLYLCDILTQLTPQGFGKILLVRRNEPGYVREDEAAAAEKGISAGEAARQSALESARKSYDIIMRSPGHEDLKQRAAALWEEIAGGNGE